MGSRQWSQLTEQQRVNAFMQWHASLSPADKTAFAKRYGTGQGNRHQ